MLSFYEQSNLISESKVGIFDDFSRIIGDGTASSEHREVAEFETGQKSYFRLVLLLAFAFDRHSRLVPSSIVCMHPTLKARKVL